jgi:SAM-dependent methyltransferase
LIAKCIASNILTAARSFIGDHQSEIGATHSHMDTARSVAYIESVFSDYQVHGGLSASDIAGKSVLEIGPGDNYGVALLFLAHGAQRVVCLDKFATVYDGAQQAAIYRALRERLQGDAARIFDATVQVGPDGTKYPSGALQPLTGVGIEDAVKKLGPQSVDLIVSRAVLEEVFEVERAFEAMHQLLKPGGVMVHKIDLRDYGLFSNRGFHPLEFLTIPGPVYSAMSSHSGLPNRRRASFYIDLLKRLGYRPNVLVTALAGVPGEITPYVPLEPLAMDLPPVARETVQAIRPRLVPPFRDLPDAELAAHGIFVSARKASNKASA